MDKKYININNVSLSATVTLQKVRNLFKVWWPCQIFLVCSLTGLSFLSSFAQVTNNHKLIFLGNKNIAPVIYLQDSIPTGVVVDIVHALAKHIPQPIEIKAMDWQQAQALVARGEADALMQINQTEERLKIYDFSEPLLESQFSIFVRADRVGISGISCLRGLHVGVEPGGLPRQYLEKTPNVLLTIIPNFLEGFKMLNEGIIDAVVVDYRVGSYVIAENKIRNIKISGEPIAFSYSCLAVKKGNTKLLNEINIALGIIKNNGTYQKIIDKWNPKETVFYTREQITRKVYFAAILVFIALFLITVFWVLTLRRELSRRRVAEERLNEQYSTLHSIIDSTNALIFSIDLQYRYTNFNKGHALVMKAIYGADIKQGQNLLECITVTADREVAKKNLDKALAGESIVEESYSGEELRLRKYFHVSHSPIISENGIIGVAVLAQDMTERKKTEEALRESENRYRRITEGLTDYEYLVRVENGIAKETKQSPACAIITGYTPEEFAADPYLWFSMVAPNDRQMVQKHVQSILSGLNMPPLEHRIIRKDGAVRWVCDTTILFKDDSGQLHSYEGVIKDITERKQAEEEIRKLNQELEKRVADRTLQLEVTNKELESFAYSVAHDLRTPLRGIDGFCQILLDEYQDKVDKQGKNYLQRVRNAAQRMAQLIDDMLNLSHVSRVGMNFQQVDLSKIAREIADNLHEAQPKRQVEFIIKDGITTQGDGSLLQIVLENLIGNSWKFTSKHAKARIEFGVQQQNNTTVYFVRDDGAGFNINHAQRLFGAFQRLHTIKEFEGTGIGLATVQRIINRHGGKIWAHGEIENPAAGKTGGATFYFTIP